MYNIHLVTGKTLLFIHSSSSRAASASLMLPEIKQGSRLCVDRAPSPESPRQTMTRLARTARLERREYASETDGDGPAAVHPDCIVAHAEKNEHEKGLGDVDPAVEENDAERGKDLRVVPVLVVCLGVAVGEDAELEVLDEDVELDWEENEDEDEGEDEEAQEARLCCAVDGEQLAEFGLVAVHAHAEKDCEVVSMMVVVMMGALGEECGRDILA